MDSYVRCYRYFEYLVGGKAFCLLMFVVILYWDITLSTRIKKIISVNFHHRRLLTKQISSLAKGKKRHLWMVELNFPIDLTIGTLGLGCKEIMQGVPPEKYTRSCMKIILEILWAY